ncbi:MAG: ice-binding family protein [Pseudomonadota bacterium]
MNYCQKYLSAGLLGIAALAVGASPAWAQVSLGRASDFSVLGATVTCTTSVIAGDVGSTGAFTNTGCTITGAMPPATNAAAVGAYADFLDAYAALARQPCQFNLPATLARNAQLQPGVYCTDAALTATDVVLTLDGKGDPNAVWIFRIGTNATGTGALTGTGFTVTMAGGGQACNVFWRVAEAVTMTDSRLIGTILAGAAITMTSGTNTLAGRALATAAVTMTNATVIGCDTLSDSPSCKPKKHHRHHKHHKGHGNGHDGDDDDDGKGNGNGKHDDDDDDDGDKKGNNPTPFKIKK